MVTLLTLTAEPLSVPTLDPFVIASGEVRATRSVLVTVSLRGGDGRVAHGLGEASCLPPVTKEDQGDSLAALRGVRLQGQAFGSFEAIESALLSALPHFPVARAGLEVALLDAWSRLDGLPLWRALGGPVVAAPLETDITLPMLAPARMAELATQWWAQGFRKLKVKAGRELDADLRALEAIVRAVPDATFQPDANAGLSLAHALAYLAGAKRLGARVTCFEQPCATLPELAELAAQTTVPIIADESVASLSQLEQALAAKALDGVNLKLAKSGGLLAARRIGVRAKQAGLLVMVGGMVETRLGMTAATQLAASLGGVDFADLDTAWLLTDDPFSGGYQAVGPRYQLPKTPGLGVAIR